MGNTPDDLDLLFKTLQSATREVLGDARLSQVSDAFCSLKRQYASKAQEAAGVYGVDHAVYCLRVLLSQQTSLRRDKKSAEGPGSLAVVRLALLYAWAKQTCKASASWAHDEVTNWSRGLNPELPGQVRDLVLVAHGEKQAETPEERLIAQVCLIADERQYRAEHRPTA